MTEIVNMNLLQKRFHYISEHFSSYYYPTKVNDNPEILKTLNNLGSGFLVNNYSHASLLVDNFNVNPSRILYIISSNDVETIKKISLLGINQFIVDTIESIEALIELKIQCKLFLRISTLDIDFDRFGISLNEVDNFLEVIKGSNLEFVGFHFHIPEKHNSFNAFKKVMKKILSAYPNIECLDIGGGYSYRILSYISKYISENTMLKNVICEIGYGLINDLVYLETQVISVKRIDSLNMATIDAGIYSGLLDVFISGRKFPIVSPKKSKNKIKYRLYGPSLDNDDCIGDYFLPPLKVGDKLIIRNTGAYVRTLQTFF